MTMFEKSFLFTASMAIAVTPAFAAPAVPTPVPLAGAGVLALGAILYVGRVIRRMR